ncbi:MAG: bifunctional phosphatase PAP2/diacylglycerol kinase family protein [Sporichthyaceae bacterium]
MRALMRVDKVDKVLTAALNSRETPRLDVVLPALSRAANHGVLWAGVGAALWATRSPELRRSALRGLGSLALASAAANGPAKYLARRPRPGLAQTPLARQLLRQPVTYSFPSGHSASAAAFATGVALENPVVAVPVAIVALGVGVSRVHNGVHYPTDVLAGFALGAAATWVLTRAWPVRPSVGPAERAPAAEVPDLGLGAGLVAIANPGAGDDAAQDVVEAVAAAFPAATVHVRGEDEDLLDLLGKAAGEATVLAVAGGDGSVNAAITVALEADLPLLVIPGGTLNHFARDLGLTSIGDALAAAAAGSACWVDVARVAVHSGPAQADGPGVVFVNNASIGAYAQIVTAREQLEERLGKWPAMVVALARILHRSEPVEVQLDGENHRLWLLFVGNCRYAPPGFAPSWRDRLDDGLLDVRLVDATRPLSRTRLVVAVLTGRLAKTPVFTARTAKQLTVVAVGDALPLARDGEVGDAAPGYSMTKTGRVRVYRADS